MSSVPENGCFGMNSRPISVLQETSHVWVRRGNSLADLTSIPDLKIDISGGVDDTSNCHRP